MPGGAAFSGGLNFPPEAEFPIIDFVLDGKFLTDFFLRLHTHWGTMTRAQASDMSKDGLFRPSADTKKGNMTLTVWTGWTTSSAALQAAAAVADFFFS